MHLNLQINFVSERHFDGVHVHLVTCVLLVQKWLFFSVQSTLSTFTIIGMSLSEPHIDCDNVLHCEKCSCLSIYVCMWHAVCLNIRLSFRNRSKGAKQKGGKEGVRYLKQYYSQGGERPSE